MDGFQKVRLYAEARINEIRREAEINGESGTDATKSALSELGNVVNFCENERTKQTAVEAAAAKLVETVEKYARQACLRSELLTANDNLKKLLR